MATNTDFSFSRWRRWSIGCNVALIIFAVLAVVVMVNYLSRQYFQTWHLSARTKIELSQRTLNLLHSVTNQVKVIAYYDTKEGLYSTIIDLLKSFAMVNPRITVQTVDYLRDPALAQKVKADCKLTSSTDKNLIIFICENRTISVDGNALAHYILEQVPQTVAQKEPEWRKKPTQFEGEARFSAALLAVTNPKRLHACFLQGHREHAYDSGGDYGYLKLTALLNQNIVHVQPLSLLGTNQLVDCNLLIVAGPGDTLSEPELDKIDKYLAQGGRMLVLFNSASINKETGLERILLKWGVRVGNKIIQDPEHFVSSVNDMVVTGFSQKHPLVNPLLGSGIYLIRPRAIGKANSGTLATDAPRVEELAFTSPRAVADGNSSPQSFPLIVAVETAIQGVVSERGSTRLLVAGDSLFLANGWIDATAGNRDFADAAINWLLSRSELLKGIGPRQITEYKVMMSNAQFRRVQWLLLAGLPGGVLVLGSAVWLRRRK